MQYLESCGSFAMVFHNLTNLCRFSAQAAQKEKERGAVRVSCVRLDMTPHQWYLYLVR